MSYVAAAIGGSALLGAYTSNRAARTQADAARDAGAVAQDATRYAADQSLTATREGNQLLRDQFSTIRADAQPYRDAGYFALSELRNGFGPGGPFGVDIGNRQDIRDLTGRIDGLMNERFNFAEDPGYQFRLAEGERALNRAALAGGRYDSGRTLKDLMRYGQGFASNEYGNAFDRFRTDRADRLNMYGGERSNRYNMAAGDRDSRFNRLSSLAGTGQTVNSQVANVGMNTAQNIAGNTIAGANNAGNMAVQGANAYGNAVTGAANARASGYVGMTNAINSGVSQGLNHYQGNQLLSLLGKRP